MAYQPKSYRKFLAGSVSAAMVASTFGAVAPVQVDTAEAAESFSDVTNDYWASGSIQRLADQGVINGYPDGTYRPGQEINRGQVAAMLVSAFGLDVDENAEPPFEDLTEESYFTPAAAAVKEAGLIKGREDNTQFAAGMDLSREQMATIMVRAFELEPIEGEEADVNDLDEAHESHQSNIEILAQYDITSTADGNFRPKESVTRAQFAVFLERALAVDFTLQEGITSVSAVDQNTVEVTFNREVDEDEVSAENFSFDPALEVVDAEVTASSETESTVTLQTEDQEAGVNYDLYFKGELTSLNTGGSTVDPDPAPEELAVEDVTASNLKEVEVQFNQDVTDWENADSVESYVLENEDGAEVSIDDVNVEGSTVRISLTHAKDQQENLSLTVSGDVLEEEETFDVELFDSAAPQVEGAEVVGIRTAKVTFSEPIQDAEDLEASFELENENGTTYNVDEVELQNGGREARITFFSDFEDGSYTLNVGEGLQDYAGYEVGADSFDFDVEADEEAPVLEGYRNASATGVTLVFDEDITLENEDLANFYHTNSSNTASNVEVDGNELHLTFDADYALPNGTANVYVAGDSVSDLWENVQEDQQSISVGVEQDTEAPAIESVEQTSVNSNEFEIEFSEDVDVDSAQDLANYTVIDANGEEVELDSASADGNTVTVTFNDAEVTGNFTLQTEGIEDVVGNASAEASTDFTMNSDVEFTAFEGGFYEQNGQTTVTVDFGREMAVDGSYSVVDLAKYEIDGVNLDNVEGADIEATNGNESVEITFATEEFQAEHGSEFTLADLADGNGELDITMARVADVNGNRTNGLSGNVTISNQQDADFGVAEVTAVSNNEVTVEFDRAFENLDDEDFEFTAGNETLTVSSVSQADNTVTFTLNEELSDDAQYNDSAVTLNTVAEADVDTTDQFGNVLSISEEPVGDGIAPSLATDGDTGVDLVTATANDTDDQVEVDLTFTENIDASTVSTASFDVEDYEVEATNVNDAVVTLVISTEDGEEANVAADLEGNTVTQTAFIRDESGNTIEDITTEIMEASNNN